MNDIPMPLPAKPERFIDKFRAFVRISRLSYKIEKTYCSWVIRFVRFYDLQNEHSLKPELIKVFLDHLALQRNVAVNTQKTALNALVFLFIWFLKWRLVTLGLPTLRETGVYRPFSTKLK